MPTKFQLITELYDQTVQSVTGSYQSWTGFLRAACYNYKCPFDDQILIYAQRPDATAVLEMERWNRQFGRWVNRGAKSIAVFGDDGQNCLKLYFDVSDTHASRFARPLPIWTMHPAFEPEVIETLEATFGNLAEKENLADAVRSACHNAVADNITDYLQDLRECREDSLLEELDDLNLEVFYRDALEVSVAYMLMTRLGLRADDYFLPDEFAHVYEFNTPPTINALGIATSDIAEMGLREISRTVMQAQRDQFFANREKNSYDDRTEQHEIGRERSKQYGGHLQDAERLSGAEFDDAQRTGGASGQVRGTAESVPEEAPQGALHQPQDQRQADGASGRDRADRAEDGGADRRADGTDRGRDGGTEGNRSPALDGPDEQSPAQRGGAGAQRPDLQLTTEEPTEAGSDELPAFVDHSGDYVLLDRLRADCDYFLGAGGRSEKHLWAGSVYAQIKKMRELYDALPEKPEWLTAEAIDRYAAQMAARYQVAAYHHFENGFDDKLDYQTLEEAEAAAQGYVAGTMEEDGFAYDGAAVYDAETHQCLRVYGNYPDEMAQQQAAAFALEHDTAQQNIFIDESHYFKNLFLYTKMRNVGGIAQTEAQKSSDLFMKCRYLDEITGGRGIVFATGTPISNSMVELYTIQRYLQMSALEEQGLQHFDAWAANYGETVTAIELSPEGTGYRAKTRFAKFYNLPELMSVFKNVADIQTADMLKLPVPEAHYHNIALKPSEYQKEIVASLAERAEKVRNREVDSSVDNMLLITNDGRKLALDQRLVNPMLPSDPNSKAAKCAENVFEIWRRTAGQRSTQMIFCDLSTPKDDGTFSVYDDIHAKLLELGIPENEIAFIHNAKSEVQKKDLFGKVRSGQVRILLGSTQRMGAGTNCQQKLIALHHLECPWRPSDLQQREGRIIRQGNENPEVDIYSYVTEGTFDAYLYQLVESKQKFISQIMTSKSPVRSAEDVDEQALSYAEIKALASGNPMIKEKMDLDIEVSKLKLLKANHLSQKYALEDAISKDFPKQIAETQVRIAGYGADIATVKENTHPNGDGFSPLTLAGVTHADKKEAGAALLTMCQTMLSPEATQVGSYRGLTLELAFDTFAREYRLTMIGQLRHTVTLGTDVFGNLQRMDNALEGLPIKEQACREQFSNLQTQLETAKAEVQKPFSREAELNTKTARLEELNSLLNLDHKEPEIVDAEPDEDQRPPERRRPQLER